MPESARANFSCFRSRKVVATDLQFRVKSFSCFQRFALTKLFSQSIGRPLNFFPRSSDKQRRRKKLSTIIKSAAWYSRPKDSKRNNWKLRNKQKDNKNKFADDLLLKSKPIFGRLLLMSGFTCKHRVLRIVPDEKQQQIGSNYESFWPRAIFRWKQAVEGLAGRYTKKNFAPIIKGRSSLSIRSSRERHEPLVWEAPRRHLMPNNQTTFRTGFSAFKSP